MTQVIVELEDGLARRLEKVAPARSRRRSAFIREAIRRALDQRLDEEMERAYRERPQAGVEADLDPLTWERAGWPAPKKPRRR